MSKWLVTITESTSSIMATVVSPPILVVSLYILQWDGWVHHQMLKLTHHVLTVMALLNLNAHTLSETSHNPNFFCELANGSFQLKHKHNYFHQVQLQLFVSGDMFSWCDFCVYTPVGVAVERIYPCKEWQSMYIPKLEDY